MPRNLIAQTRLHRAKPRAERLCAPSARFHNSQNCGLQAIPSFSNPCDDDSGSVHGSDGGAGGGCAGLGALGERLSSVKTYLQSQIRALTTKQDQTIAAQGAMQEHLNVVGRDVEETRCEVSEVLPLPPEPAPRPPPGSAPCPWR